MANTPDLLAETNQPKVRFLSNHTDSFKEFRGKTISVAINNHVITRKIYNIEAGLNENLVVHHFEFEDINSDLFNLPLSIAAALTIMDELHWPSITISVSENSHRFEITVEQTPLGTKLFRLSYVDDRSVYSIEGKHNYLATIASEFSYKLHSLEKSLQLLANIET